MIIAGPHYLWQISKYVSIKLSRGGEVTFIYHLFIYLSETYTPTHEVLRCVCARKLCYLSGTVISWALLSWLDPASAVPSSQWMISCPPLEGKSWFLFPPLTAQPPKPIVLQLYQFSSQYLSHLIFFCLFPPLYFCFLFFLSFLCLWLFRNKKNYTFWTSTPSFPHSVIILTAINIANFVVHFLHLVIKMCALIKTENNKSNFWWTTYYII